METMESLAQAVEDVKVEVAKDVFKETEGADLDDFLDVVEKGVRKFVRAMLETYAKNEFLRYIGAKPYERTQERRDYRNGNFSKTILSPFGLIEDITIPRGRKGGFIPKVLDRFKAFKEKIANIVVEIFTLGISTRKIKRVTKLIAGKGILRSEASRLNQTIKGEIIAWLNRPIEKKFTYLFIDGIFLKIRRKIISKEAVLCAVGKTESGEKEFLGFIPGGRESREAWEEFLTHLVRRGLDPRSVQLVISDGCPGMINAIKTIFPYSDHQHCLFHKMSNLRAKCPRSEWPLIKAKINKIYFALSETEARANAKAFIREY